MRCEFNERGQCPTCKFQLPGDVPRSIYRNCTPKPLSKRLAWLRYVASLAKWSAAGFPRRERWDYLRVRAICERCKKWDSKKEACTFCGCSGQRSGPVWRNKLMMTTETCPLGKW